MTRKKKQTLPSEPAEDPTPLEPSSLPEETIPSSYTPLPTTGTTLPSSTGQATPQEPIPSSYTPTGQATPQEPQMVINPEVIRNIALELGNLNERISRIEAAPAAAGAAASMTGAAPRSRLDALMDMVGQIAGAAQKVIPQQSGAGELQNRLIDMALRGIDQNNQMAEVVKMGIAKQLGIDVAPKPMHVVATQ